MKNGVNCGNGFAIGDTNTKSCPLKCLIFQTNEESFTFVAFKTDKSNQIKSNGSSCIQEFLFEVRFYFSSKKGH